MKIPISLALALANFTSFAQVDPVDRNQIAIGGYDVVSYFNSGKAAKGDNRYRSRHENVTYLFSTEENQQLFEKEPQTYLPQYDGYCALAVSYGQKISIDPQTFKIVNDKLYLFFNGTTRRGKVNSIETWNKNELRLLEKADRLWPDVKKKKYNSKETL